MFSLKNWTQRHLMTKQLKSEEVAEREEAIEQIGTLGDPADVKLLVPCLHDESASVRRVAVRALRRIGDPSAIAPLMAGLRGPGPGGAWQVEILAALEQFNDPRSVPACVIALENGDVRVRQAAAATLGTLGQESAIEPLLKAVSDEHADVSRDAAYALAKIGPPALPGLIEIMQRGSTQAKISTALALGVLADRRALPALLAALKEKDSYLQIAVAKALPLFHDASVIKPLVEALEVSATAAFYYGVRDEAETALVKIGPPVIDALLEALARACPAGQLAIIRLLRELPDPRSFNPLVELLHQATLDVRKAALAALLKVDRKNAAQHIIPLLDDPDAGLRYSAGEALMGAGWKGDSPRDRARLLAALGQYSQALKEGEEAVAWLLHLVADTEPQVRRETVRALGHLKEARFLPTIQAAALKEHDPEAQAAFTEALDHLGEAGSGALVTLLEEGCWTMRHRAGQCLLRRNWQPQTEKQRVITALVNGKVEAATTADAECMRLIESALKEGEAATQVTATLVLQKIQTASKPA